MTNESKTVPEPLREIAAAEHGIELAEMFRGLADRVEREYMQLPLDADGEPIKPGDKVCFFGGNDQFEVFGYDFEDGELLVHIGRGDRTSTDACVLPTDITHKKTDTLERIEEDARKTYEEYWGCVGVFDCDKCPGMVDLKKPWERYATSRFCENAQTLDLLRRQRELLERGQA